MVLVGERSAEHREDAVAGRLHDVAVVAMDRSDHQLEGGIDDGASFLGSSSCSSSVVPLISANKAVTVFRSPSIGSGSALLRVTLMTGRLSLMLPSEAARLPHQERRTLRAELGFKWVLGSTLRHRRLKGVAH